MTESDQQSNNVSRDRISFHGLNRRVARKLGKSDALVSMVNSGKAKSHQVSVALEIEREQMRREQAEKERQEVRRTA